MITLDCLNFATPIEITSYEDGQPSSRHSKRQLHFMPFDENTQCHLGSNILKKKKSDLNLIRPLVLCSNLLQILFSEACVK